MGNGRARKASRWCCRPTVGPDVRLYSELLHLEYLGDLEIPGMIMKVFALGDAFVSPCKPVRAVGMRVWPVCVT
jgi:hypothetical protein